MALFKGPIVAVGKIAGEAEYLRAETEAGALFDSWLDAGFEAAFERWGEAWRAALRKGSPYAFVWWPAVGSRTEGPLCGVLAPSRDAVGRDYPLAVFGHACVEIVDRAPHVVLLALGGFLDQVWGVIDVARCTPMTRSELSLRMRELPYPQEDEATRAAAEYDAWCQAASVREGWNAVLPVGGDMASIERIVAEIEHGAAGGLLRLPVGGGAGAVALWLDIASRVLGGGEGTHSAFWSPDNHSLVVASESSRASVVGGLWGPKQPALIDPKAPSEPRADPGLVMATDASRSMAEFLESLVRVKTVIDQG
jgi:type VI secretion system ImpM family protein